MWYLVEEIQLYGRIVNDEFPMINCRPLVYSHSDEYREDK